MSEGKLSEGNLASKSLGLHSLVRFGANAPIMPDYLRVLCRVNKGEVRFGSVADTTA